MHPQHTIPTRDSHARAWTELAGAIADIAPHIVEAPPTAPPAEPGELTVIGSGIETVGFALGDEGLIRAADAVFYCVADPATVLWIKSIRPDAFDLYVLYDDSKVRYTTYMQMAEAMLYFVRRGKRVVSIFYGHPGVFVLSTHRAILVARREGHRATMRANVSALDCLCADLGVDPAQPGMQTHEATDMLIRARVPDTTLHVVLWQVGLIGEMGYRRKGYINQNFSIFVSYLQKHYGDEYPVIHYVASRYPTIDPVIEHYPLSKLHDPAVQALVTGISTFYLAPKDVAEPDVEMLQQLGMAQPGQTVRANVRPLREIGLYGPRERKAFTAFARFRVPKGYQWQEDTGASRFLIALKEDAALRQQYLSDPQAAVTSFEGLSTREQTKLATRNAGAIQVAAKGVGIANEGNQALLTALFSNRNLQTSLLQCLRGTPDDGLLPALAEWSKANGHVADWAQMRTDIDLASRDNLFAWSGIYRAGERLIVITGTGAVKRLCVDDEPVRRFSFRWGVLKWAQGKGCPHSGFVRVDLDGAGRRRLIGAIWPSGTLPADHKLVANEVQPGHRHAASLAGAYCRMTGAVHETLEIGVASTAAQGRHLQFLLNGQPVAESPLSADWRQEGGLPGALCGAYRVWTATGQNAFSLDIDGQRIQIGDAEPASVEYVGRQIHWSGGPIEAPSGQVTLVLDPITLFPALFGTVDGGRCYGLVAPSADLLRRPAEFGLSERLWDQLVALTARPDLPAGLLLWHAAEKSNQAAHIIHNLLARRLP
jgi:Tetrapyrrole (Corrin/Porphyrin) Methylases